MIDASVPISNVGRTYCLTATRPIEVGLEEDVYAGMLVGIEEASFGSDSRLMTHSDGSVGSLAIDKVERKGDGLLALRRDSCGDYLFLARGAYFSTWEEIGSTAVPLDTLPEPGRPTGLLKPGAAVMWPDGSRAGAFEGSTSLEIHGEIHQRSAMRCAAVSVLVAQSGSRALLCFRTDDLEELHARPSAPAR